jgi:hypothetical protein
MTCGTGLQIMHQHQGTECAIRYFPWRYSDINNNTALLISRSLMQCRINEKRNRVDKIDFDGNKSGLGPLIGYT